MSAYFVAGGTYTDLNGDEWFDLVCPGPGDPPYVLLDHVTEYFSLLWQNAHLYRVEDDYSLSLVVITPEALQWGVKAPVKVWPEASLIKKLQAVIEHASITPGEINSKENLDPN